jgi:hypothetical protein
LLSLGAIVGPGAATGEVRVAFEGLRIAALR